MLRRPLWILLLAVAAAGYCQAKTPKAKNPPEPPLSSRIPLGINGFFLRPARRTLYLLGTAESRWFEGLRIVGEGPKRTLLAANGSPVQHYPQQLQFRITASAFPGYPLDVERDFLDWNGDLNQLLLNLGFRIKVFHGLKATTVEPDSVELVGMPADVPYDERIYRTAFTLPSEPIVDRIVLEVLNPKHERLCKFHLEF